MSWFGWITKSKMEVTGLDELIAAGELIGLILVGGAIYIGVEMFKRKRRKKVRT